MDARCLVPMLKMWSTEKPVASRRLGCGGLVSTAADLTRFLRAFVEDRIFRAPATKKRMLSWIATGELGVLLWARRAPLRSFSLPPERVGRALGPHRIPQELHALLASRRCNTMRHAEPGNGTRRIFEPPPRCCPHPGRAPRIAERLDLRDRSSD